MTGRARPDDQIRREYLEQARREHIKRVVNDELWPNYKNEIREMLHNAVKEHINECGIKSEVRRIHRRIDDIKGTVSKLCGLFEGAFGNLTGKQKGGFAVMSGLSVAELILILKLIGV
jgi:hypothetical protein